MVHNTQSTGIHVHNTQSTGIDIHNTQKTTSLKVTVVEELLPWQVTTKRYSLALCQCENRNRCFSVEVIPIVFHLTQGDMFVEEGGFQPDAQKKGPTGEPVADVFGAKNRGIFVFTLHDEALAFSLLHFSS
jgi:hypothetical protein